MLRHHLAKNLSGEELSLDAVWDWYEFQTTLIREERVRTLAVLLTGAPLSNSRYFARTRDELVAFFDQQNAEIGNAAMLNLLAATEAALRVDYIGRVMHRKKDELSKAFTALYQEQGLKVGLEEQILDLWKQHSPRATNEAIGRFNGSLNLRHWLAHGRYWIPRLGQEYDPQDVLEICRVLLETTGA